MKPIVIAATDGPKAHAFRATLLCYVTADLIWGNDAVNAAIRPAFAMLAGTEQTMKAFNANLRMGRKAFLPEDRANRGRDEGRRVEMMKSAAGDGYDVFSQRVSIFPVVQPSSAAVEPRNATVTTWVIPSVFQLDSGMVDPKSIGFVVLPSDEWLDQNTSKDAVARAEARVHAEAWLRSRPPPEEAWVKLKSPDNETLEYLIDIASLFVAYLDRRTRCPIHSDFKFYVQLLLACLEEGLASFPVDEGYRHQESLSFGCWKKHRLVAYGLEHVGLTTPIQFHGTHEAFEALLARETRRFFCGVETWIEPDPEPSEEDDDRAVDDDAEEDEDESRYDDDSGDENEYARECLPVRTPGQALAGYYPTPVHLLPRIARLIDIGDKNNLCAVDPCAGEGTAIVGMADLLVDRKSLSTGFLTGRRNVRLYTCEMEPTRAKVLRKLVEKYGYDNEKLVVNGDAFYLSFDIGDRVGANLLWLNPPYDADQEHARLEEAFLSRFHPVLAQGGILAFLIPATALKRSARTLATYFSDVRIWRFPDEDYAAYKQVLVLAKRGVDLLQHNPSIEATVLAVGETLQSNPALIPIIPEEADEVSPILSEVTAYSLGFDEWKLLEIDLMQLCEEIRPWHQTRQGGSPLPVDGFLPWGGGVDLLKRTYPMATPPRAAHIVAGIAAGIYNGVRISPDDPASGLPDLELKGAYDREWKQVDEKTNSDGVCVGVVEVQQPKLRTTVLDLSTFQYHTLPSGTTANGGKDIAQFNTADLLHSYGRAMMASMRQQCPVMFDPENPADHFPVRPLKRPLYPAQENVARALLKLLGGPNVPLSARKNKAAFFLGEIGSGKSGTSYAVARHAGAKRILVSCPPHLLQGWQDQIAEIEPEAKCVVLREIADVIALSKDTSPGPVVAILSRETGKLGHSWDTVYGTADTRQPPAWFASSTQKSKSIATCPRCGRAVSRQYDYSKKRETCGHKRRVPSNRAAHVCRQIATRIYPICPDLDLLPSILDEGLLRRRIASMSEKPLTKEAQTESLDLLLDGSFIDHVGQSILRALSRAKKDRDTPAWIEALCCLVMASPRPERIKDWAVEVYDLARPHATTYGTPARSLVQLAQGLILMLKGEHRGHALRQIFAVYDRPNDWKPGPDHDPTMDAGFDPSWTDFWRKLDGHNPSEFAQWVETDAGFCFESEERKPLQWLQQALRVLYTSPAIWAESEPCPERLYQAIPDPRRVPLATYIQKHHKRLFDFLLLDEIHEANHDGSAQERAAHRLMALGCPAVLLTGSIMNGYADSLFPNFWYAVPAFRNEFDRDAMGSFVRRYGFLKRVLEDRDEDGKVVAYGSMSDRVETKERVTGNAPGVLPLFLLRHLLPSSVTLHKSDLKQDLPPFTEEQALCYGTPLLLKNYHHLRDTLLEQIKADMFSPMAGKLWGALGQLPSYLDRATADVGNTPEGRFILRYPDNVGGGIVAEVDPIPADTVLPKELWLLKYIDAELTAGHRVMVFGWHENLFPRLKRLIEKNLGLQVPFLEAKKVPTAKRQDWIDRKVVSPKQRVLLVNPVAVQTGLNNLTWFSRAVWYQDPGCNPVVVRQANGRIDRIGQKAAQTKSLYPIYKDTTQEVVHKLLQHKIGVSLATDGLDPETALIAAGAGDNDALAGFSLGKQIYEMLTRGEKKTR